MKTEWTLVALYRAMLEDLKSCNTQTEVDCCRAINRREILSKASELQKTRKLTPGEQSVLLNI